MPEKVALPTCIVEAINDIANDMESDFNTEVACLLVLALKRMFILSHGELKFSEELHKMFEACPF